MRQGEIFDIYVIESLFQPEENAPGQVLCACDSYEVVVDRLGRLAKQMSVKAGDWDIYLNRGVFYAQMWAQYDQTYMFRITKTRLYTSI